MRYRRFPALDSSIAELGYGSWPLSGVFGGFDEDTAIRSVLDYLDAGGNFSDTARDYGRAEEILGRALNLWTGQRPIVATKAQGLGPTRRWGSPVALDEVYPQGQIRKSARNSAKALGVAQLDLLQLHVYWATWGVTGRWLDELVALRDEGLIRAIGVSMPDYRHDMALELVRTGAIDSVQTIVNIFDPLALDCLGPAAAEHGVALIARGVLDEGGLTDSHAIRKDFEDRDLRGVFFSPAGQDEYRSRVEPLLKMIPSHAGSLSALAIKAVLAQSNVTTAIVSMPTPDLVAANVGAVGEPVLDQKDAHRLVTRHRWVRNFFEPVYWSDEP